MVTPAGTARAEDPLGQVFFLTKLAEAVPAASIHRQATRENQHQSLTALLDGNGVKASRSPQAQTLSLDISKLSLPKTGALLLN
ncbi:hypothetical protein [Halobacillus sp. K22]|uniref:hypothetical protein n=1 Tax=Halobacillus sp. K22 TaxID=3457431 RepID=UPI003FCE053F